MKIHALTCKKCKYTIFSRARHDYRVCKCGACSIDGGFDYCKVSGHVKNFLWSAIDIKVTEEELYNDWNKAIDKYGIHTKAEIKKLTKKESKRE
jgi:hypothetical protein